MSLREDGKLLVTCDGQFGSTGKGLLGAWIGKHEQPFNICMTNASANAGHTAWIDGKKVVCYHLPMIAVANYFYHNNMPDIFLTAGSIIDPALLLQEVMVIGIPRDRIYISPYAAVITPIHKETEMKKDSRAELIASTQKGVGAALADKVTRQSLLAGKCKALTDNFNVQDVGIAEYLHSGAAISMEVPQGYSLGINSGFYPYCTSRECTVAQGLADAKVSPRQLGKVAMAIRSFPIRVGAVPDAHSYSGGWYSDQVELTWGDVGAVPETTTVTGRERRIASFSLNQFTRSVLENQPDLIFMNFMNYCTPDEEKSLDTMVRGCYDGIFGRQPDMLYGYGPQIGDVYDKVRGSVSNPAGSSAGEDAAEQPQGGNQQVESKRFDGPAAPGD